MSNSTLRNHIKSSSIKASFIFTVYFFPFIVFFLSPILSSLFCDKDLSVTRWIDEKRLKIDVWWIMQFCQYIFVMRQSSLISSCGIENFYYEKVILQTLFYILKNISVLVPRTAPFCIVGIMDGRPLFLSFDVKGVLYCQLQLQGII